MLVRQAWVSSCRGSRLELVWQKLKAVKRVLKSLHLTHFVTPLNFRTHFKNLHEKISFWRAELDHVQSELQHSPLSFDLHRREIHATNVLRKWLCIEECGLRQKSRIAWLHDGDSNSHYFHSIVKDRCKKNRIDALVDDDGAVINDPDTIRRSITLFYQNLLGKAADSLKGIDLQAMHAGPKLSMAQA